MDQKLFEEYMIKSNRPSQNYSEWKMFLEICEIEIKKRGIENPVAVELGIWRNKQKKFFTDLLNADHISIDIGMRRSSPDIMGNTHNPKTMATLKEKLAGRPINILFIDAGHAYEDAKKDFEDYSPLCTDIIALHDIWCHRYSDRSDMQVYRLWDELKQKAYNPVEKKYKQFLFIDLYRYRGAGNGMQMGIGMMIRQ